MNKSSFQDFTNSPFKIILHTADQLRLARSADILHIDATGGLVRNSIYTGKNIYQFSIVPASRKEEISCVSVRDFLSERCRVENVAYWLHTFRNGVSRVCGERLMRTAALSPTVRGPWSMLPCWFSASLPSTDTWSQHFCICDTSWTAAEDLLSYTSAAALWLRACRRQSPHSNYERINLFSSPASGHCWRPRA